MEYLDYYDEAGNYLGYKTRDEVLTLGLWHNTIHCWLYELEGFVYFQIRKDNNKFYTTASGHVLKGESIKDAFHREIKEEIGLDIDSSDATLVSIVPWKMDKIKKDGSTFKDRAKANVYIDLFEGNINSFSFDEEEVLGVCKVKAKDVLEIFKNEEGYADACIIKTINGKNIIENKKICKDDFTLMEHETLYGKYGEVIKKIIEVTNKS